MKWAAFSSKTDNVPKQKEDDWPSFARKFSVHDVREEKDGGLFSPATYIDGAKRGNEGVAEVGALVLDFDAGHAPDDFLEHWRDLGLSFVAASTFSHTPEHPKWRVVFELETAVEKPLWHDFWLRANEHLAGGLCDPACKDPARIFYTPACPAAMKEHAWSVVNEGRPLRSSDLPALPKEDVDASKSVRAQPTSRQFDEAFSWDELMFMAGGHSPRRVGNYTFWWRPGKTRKDGSHSARTGDGTAGDRFYNWSSEWTNVPLMEVCSKFRLYVYLRFGSCTPDTYKQAHQELRAMGIETGEPKRERAPAPKKPSEEPECDERPEEPYHEAFEGRERKEVCVNGRQLRDVTGEVFSEVVHRNDPAEVFVRNSEFVHVVRHDRTKRWRIRQMQDADLRLLASEACDFYRVNKDGERTACPPPDKIGPDLKAYWARHRHGIPYIEGISLCPVMRPDRTFATVQGYDPETMTYLADDPYTEWDKSLGRPLQWLFTELLGEFPFDSEASKANALALVLLPFVRRAIEGPTPLHYVGSPDPGVGKTLTVQACLWPGCGDVNMANLSQDEEERRKKIGAALMDGRPFVFLDNVKGRVDSGCLALALTARNYTDRFMGTMDNLDVPVRCGWAMTGNNVEFDRDTRRRTVWIQIDTKEEDPERRSGWRHPNLLGWAEENRRTLVAACVQAVRDWDAEGAPLFTERTMGTYEEYAGILGGILGVAGYTEFIANQEELAERNDPVDEGLKAFFKRVGDARGTSEFAASDVLEDADEVEGVARLIGDGTDRSRGTRLGRKLQDLNGKVRSKLRLEKTRILNGKQMYRLIPVEGHALYDPYADDAPLPDPEPRQVGLPYKDDND